MSQARDILASLFPLVNLGSEELKVIDQISETDATLFVRSLYRECKSSPESAGVLAKLVALARQSDVDINVWVSDVNAVYRWFEQRAVTARALDVLEYISCAREGSSSQSGYSIEWYLDNYGFEKLR